MSAINSNDIKTTTIDESLIDFVRQNPTLCEKGNRVKPYESMKERFELWKSIATSLGLEPNYCMLRWKHLRDRYQKEITKEIQQKASPEKVINDASTHWPLMEKMRFIGYYNSHRRHYSHINKHIDGKQKLSPKAEQPFTGINYEEPLQEAMDEQPLTSTDAARKATVTPIAIQSDNKIAVTSSVLARIEALLGGLDLLNRSLAEKRILSYLCKCQLKILEGENIDDVQL